MSLTPTVAKPASFGRRVLYAVPLIGTIARDITHDVNNVFYALVILVTLVVLAVMTWGLVALAMTALALVPLVFVLLLWITWA